MPKRHPCSCRIRVTGSSSRMLATRTRMPDFSQPVVATLLALANVTLKLKTWLKGQWNSLEMSVKHQEHLIITGQNTKLNYMWLLILCNNMSYVTEAGQLKSKYQKKIHLSTRWHVSPPLLLPLAMPWMFPRHLHQRFPRPLLDGLLRAGSDNKKWLWTVAAHPRPCHEWVADRRVMRPGPKNRSRCVKGGKRGQHDLAFKEGREKKKAEQIGTN